MTSAAVQLAAEQLHRLAGVSNGTIEVMSGLLQRDEWAYFEISLDLRDVKSTDGGIGLRERERFVIAVSEQYPFVSPRVLVRHRRWAGGPHVSWTGELCLYLAPSLEWSPQDGMRGLIDRLVCWIEAAATGTLDPPGQPPHPPVASVVPEAGFAIVHADVGCLADPAARGEVAGQPGTLIGWGSLIGDRLDVRAWLPADEFEQRFAEDSLPDVGSEQPVAVACVLLDDPIAFEYPRTYGELARGLRSAGLGHRNFHALLQQTAVASAAYVPSEPAGKNAAKQALPPLTVFIGSPSRSVDGNDRQVHLVAFSLDMETPDVQALEDSIADNDRPTAAATVNADKQLAWRRVYESRSEVTVRRDHGSPMVHLRGKRVLVLGCGALGAPITEHCARAEATVTVADNGTVSPGILVRQPYYDTDIGAFKVAALAQRLNGIDPATDDVTVIDEDIIAAVSSGRIPATDFELIIDASANAGVRAAIESARSKDRAAWPALVTVLVNHAATLGLVTVSLPGSTGGGHDVLRRVGIAAREPGSALEDIVESFFPDAPHETLFQPEPGCSEPTFTGSSADVTALASAMLLSAVDVVLSGEDEFAPMTALAVRSPRGGLRIRELARPAVSAIGWSNDVTKRDASNRFEVRLSRAALVDVRAEIRRRARMHPLPVETGGMLLGYADESVGCIWLDRACPPTPDSMLSTHHFVHGVEGAKDVVEDTQRRTAAASGFVGIWHSHPDGQAAPSKTDELGMASLVVPISGMPSALMLIVAGAEPAWSEWRDGDGTPTMYVRHITSTAVGAEMTQTPRPGGEYVRAGDPAAVKPPRPGSRRSWLRRHLLWRRGARR